MKQLCGRWARARLGFAAAVVFSGMLWVGCGSDSGGGGVGPAAPSNPLVLSAGYAWVLDEDSDAGVILTADRKIFAIERGVSGVWDTAAEGTYTMKVGDSLIVNFVPDDPLNGTWKYKLSNNNTTLTLTPGDNVAAEVVTLVFTKTKLDEPPNPGTGGDLVLDDGSAWVNAEQGSGLIFQENGSVKILAGQNGIWVECYAETYTNNEGTVTFTVNPNNPNYPNDWAGSGTYTVTGNDLAITIGNENRRFTNTPNVNIIPFNSNPGSPVLGSGQAWVADGEFGLIFQSDFTVSVISSYNNAWESEGEGTYSASRGSIMLDVPDCFGPAAINGPYYIHENTLIIVIDGEAGFFTKTSGVTVTPPSGGNLVLQSGTAWTYSEGDLEVGFIFLTEGRVLEIQRETGRIWEIIREGTYQKSGTNGADIAIYWFDGTEESGNYSVDGVSLALKLDGYRMSLRMSNATVSIPTGLVLPDGQAWTMFGTTTYLFLADRTVLFLIQQGGAYGTWSVLDEGLYYISGSGISLYNWESGEEDTEGTYTISGNTLHWTNSKYGPQDFTIITVGHDIYPAPALSKRKNAEAPAPSLSNPRADSPARERGARPDAKPSKWLAKK